VGSKQSGFVLVSSIWLVLIMLVFAGFFSFYASQQVNKANFSKERIKESLDHLATEQTLFFLIATNKKTIEGLQVSGLKGEELKLDGSRYQGLGNVSFALNDYYGLVGLNAIPNLHLDQLLTSFEPDKMTRQSLVDALFDYIDLDQLKRWNGQEGFGYLSSGLSGPSNDYLKSVQELRAVYGWQDWLEAHPEFSMELWLSPSWREWINLNTVPEELIHRILPVTRSEANKLIDKRRIKPFETLGELFSVLGPRAILDEDYYTLFPKGDVQIRIFSTNNRKLSTIGVVSTPMSTGSPWVIDYRYQRERKFDFSEPARVGATRYLKW
jgi:type II secretory pathway component PulK